ncbi:unnamed protein product [Periconia digitata]|uniref:Uncharacterized protein n=1 Tax=Periconia digitata TaxID=1303443 RepID=A0A9W4UXD8_9PLEO|nr:unnamed protein product [Periconia digitata]
MDATVGLGCGIYRQMTSFRKIFRPMVDVHVQAKSLSMNYVREVYGPHFGRPDGTGTFT